jgi:2-iminobutanoate/2-iminopropanoate deaminase
MKTLITAPGAPSPIGPFSPGVRLGDWIYLSGQGGFVQTGGLISDDVEEQTAQTFRNIEALLGAEGSSLDEVVSCLVHLADLADFGKMNGVYAQHFDGVRPARTTVRADLVAGMKVEITVVAHRGSPAA